MAAALQAQGALPSSLTLWAAENPLVNDASRVSLKVHAGVKSCCLALSAVHRALLTLQVDAGAQVIVTQPPLLWDRFAAWHEAVSRYPL